MLRILLSVLGLIALASPAPALEIELKPVEVAEMKALFGRIESRFEVPARGRIGGTVTELSVTEGDTVAAGQVIARIVDEKLELELAAAEARIEAAQSQLTNAETELTRGEALLERGSTTLQATDRLRTNLTVAQNAVAELSSARAVILQQMAEGDVQAPAAGRVLTVPARKGEVIMAGEPVAVIAAGQVFLRLALPERHATGLQPGATVRVGEGDAAQDGQVEKVYPLIEGGRVTVDVAVDGLADTFIGQRVLVRVPVGSRMALAVPAAAIRRSAGLDLVDITEGGETRTVAVVPGSALVTENGPLVEILSGLRAGDMVVLP